MGTYLFLHFDASPLLKRFVEIKIESLLLSINIYANDGM